MFSKSVFEMRLSIFLIIISKHCQLSSFFSFVIFRANSAIILRRNKHVCSLKASWPEPRWNQTLYFFCGDI